MFHLVMVCTSFSLYKVKKDLKFLLELSTLCSVVVSNIAIRDIISINKIKINKAAQLSVFKTLQNTEETF